MLKASKYCSPTPLSRGRVLWSLIPAEFRKDMTGGVNYRDTQRCEGTEIPVRISAGGFIPSSWLWLTTGSLPRGHSVLLNNVGKAGFVCEKWWSEAPCCKKRGSRCILDSNLKGTGMPFFWNRDSWKHWAKSHLFHWSPCLHTGCSPPCHQLSVSAVCFLSWVPALPHSCLVSHLWAHFYFKSLLSLSFLGYKPCWIRKGWPYFLNSEGAYPVLNLYTTEFSSLSTQLHFMTDWLMAKCILQVFQISIVVAYISAPLWRGLQDVTPSLH